MHVSLEKLVGKASKVNIYSPWGVLLLPRETKITRDHIEKLMKHDIVIHPNDIVDYKPNKYAKMIDETVPKVKEVFDEVRETLHLPLSELQRDVVPVLTEITEGVQITSLFTSLQAKDDYTYRHNIAVGAISNMIGKWLKLNDTDLLNLSIAGLLHDVGKMKVPEEILNKPGRLTDEEFAEMKKHTIYGYDIIRQTSGTNKVHALVALQHHERLDGSGYPYGLKKDDIHYFSRIVAVADIFHAMTSKRVYRDASPFYEVLYQMNNDTFGALDPEITTVFINRIMSSLTGSDILLTDGRQGTIIMIHQNDPLHPIVQVGERYIDLRKDRSVHIEKIF